MKKIAFVNPTLLMKRPISEIRKKLSQKGYDTSLLVPKKLFQKRDSKLHHENNNEEKVYTYSTINPPFLSSEQPIPATPSFIINVFKIMKRNDIIHLWVPYYLTSLKIILIKKLFFPKKKLILTMDTIPGYSFSMGKTMDKIFLWYNKLFAKIIFGTPEKITLYGRSLIPYALAAGVPENKIMILPTGISKKNLESTREDVRKELIIKPDTKIIFYAGLMVPRKGITKIIKIAEQLKDKNVLFLLAGDGPQKKDYQLETQKKGLENKIRFLGWRTDMNRLYQASDIVLLTAEGEGLPGIIMEAMSYGIPCVASNIPCIPDLIDDGKNGFLCNKDDILEFSNRIKQLLNDDELRTTFGIEAINKMNDFDWDDIILKYETLYEKSIQ